MAVDRVHVVAQPHAGVGDLHARGRGVLGQRDGQRAGGARLDALLEPEEAGRLGHQPAVDPSRHQRVVVVAGQQQQLAARAERASEVAEQRRGELERRALRPVTQLERVAEDHEPVDTAHGLEQRLAQVGSPQQVRARVRADVQVGDHQRPHAS